MGSSVGEALRDPGMPAGHPRLTRRCGSAASREVVRRPPPSKSVHRLSTEPVDLPTALVDRERQGVDHLRVGRRAAEEFRQATLLFAHLLGGALNRSDAASKNAGPRAPPGLTHV